MTGANGNGQSKLMFWVLGIAISVLFTTVGLLVQDVRGDIEDHRLALAALERQVIKLQGDLHEEQRLTQQIREWYMPLIARLDQTLQLLQRQRQGTSHE